MAKKLKLQPINERLLIKVEDSGNITPSGLIIPEQAKEKPKHGRVIFIGRGEDMNEDIQEGDIVYFGKYAGQEIVFNGVELLVLEYSDVLAKVSEVEVQDAPAT